AAQYGGLGSGVCGGRGNGSSYGSAILSGGAGDDTINVSAGFHLVSGGAGADKFVLALNARATITDFTGGAGGDTIDLSGLTTGGATAATTTLGAAVTPASTATFGDFLNAAAAGHAAAATNAVTSWFQYAGNTYIVVDNNASDAFVGGPYSGDQVVTLTGLIDLSHATLTSADLLTLA
ncbi:MAG: hypothetical protein WAZ34_16025, partial [Rhodocyclaceae bacterium]